LNIHIDHPPAEVLDQIRRHVDEVQAAEDSTRDTDRDAAFEQWCIVELFGRQRFAGRVREVTLAGAGMWRLDVPAIGDAPAVTQFINPTAVYRLTPTTEAIARAMATRDRPEPVQRFELPAAPPDRHAEAADADGNPDPWREDDEEDPS